MTLVPSADARAAAERLDAIFRDAYADVPLTRRHDDGFDEGVWETLVDGGWHLLGASAGSGGAGFALADLTGIAETYGRWLAGVPLLPTIHVNAWITADGGAPLPMATYRLPGDAGLAPFGDLAGIAVLTGDEVAERSADARGTAYDGFAYSLPLAGTGAAGPELTRGRIDELGVLLAASGVGAAESALRQACEHAKTRVQFGKPIGQYQAIAHLLADMFTYVALARSAVSWAVGNPGTTARAVGASLKLALDAVEGAVHVLGGRGFTWESGVHFYLRHILQCRKVVQLAGQGALQPAGRHGESG
ncbi:acyl-CoA dehydrogenase family protein [Streptosporangium sp. NPDC051022]|uniref:acyl-CoA dehydrogenase family protein n=1 Tax=Streptosporangium sp. NPDC051022 TaxID=3155752 RepID=UPI00343AEC03